MDDWKKTLGDTFDDAEKKEQQEQNALAEADKYINSVVLPAFNEVNAELKKNGMVASVSGSNDSASFTIRENDMVSYQYKVRINIPIMNLITEMRHREGGQLYRVAGSFIGGQDSTIADVSKEEIIKHLVADYTQHIKNKNRG